MEKTTLFRNDEKAVFSLREIYRSYGYSQYKMNKFEEYDLYVKNKDFLVSDRVITFTDVSGKLLALKPDVTMSIINDTKDIDGYVSKVCYSENVYRASKGAYAFKEIMQTGLECIGDIDLYNISEVVFLAKKSLESISDEYVLDISHLGFIKGLLDESSLSQEQKNTLVTFFGEKNLYAVSDLLKSAGENESLSKKIVTLASSYGKLADMLLVLEDLDVNAETHEALNELRTLYDNLEEFGDVNNINLDFSVVNNMKYYDGIVFAGYIADAPKCVLSGGQYGMLMKKMGRRSRAIGFAVYLDLLDAYQNGAKRYDADVLITYDENEGQKDLIKYINKFIKDGESVIAQKATDAKIICKKAYRLKNGELKKEE